MEHECAISDMLGDICAADHVVKIPQTFTLCSGMTTNCEVHNGGATSAVGLLLSLVVS